MPNIFIYANCQGGALQRLIDYSSRGNADLNISFMENWRLMNGDLNINDFTDDIKSADYFLYQPLQAGHGYISTEGDDENILSLLPSHCVKISFGYLRNDGLWPCFIDGDILANASIIDKHLLDGAKPQDVLDLYDRGEMFFDLQKRTECSLDILAERELKTDIKIAGYIADIMYQHPVFLTQNHPTTRVLANIAIQFFKLTGVNYHIEPNIFDGLSDNFSGLPGYYPVSTFTTRELKTSYFDPPESADAHYRSLIERYMGRLENNN